MISKQTGWSAWGEAIAIVILLGGLFAARFPFRHVFLIRDEGEYAYIGQRILEGAVPYADVYNQKTPFVFYLMAGIQAIFGTEMAPLRLATAGYGAVTALLLFFLVRRLFGPAAGIGAVLAFGVMTFDQCGIIHSASTEFFMLLWMVVAVDLWYRRRTSRKWWLAILAGGAAGLAYQTKQSGIALLAFFVLEEAWFQAVEASARSPGRALRDAGCALLGFAVVFGAVAAFFAARGALPQFIECTLTNNREYVGDRYGGFWSFADRIRDVLALVAGVDAALWVWGSAGLVFLAFRGRGQAGRGLWILLFLTAATAFGSGRLYVHYFEPFIVPLAIGNGLASTWLIRALFASNTRLPLRCLLGACLVAPWIAPGAYWARSLMMPEKELARTGFQDFALAPRVARYLAERTSREEPILIVGSEPEIYYYANRKACTRLVFTYPFIAPYSYAARLREEFRRDLDDNLPRYVLVATNIWSLTEWPGFLQSSLPAWRVTLDQKYVIDHVFPGSTGRFAAYMVFRKRETRSEK